MLNGRHGSVSAATILEPTEATSPTAFNRRRRPGKHAATTDQHSAIAIAANLPIIFRVLLHSNMSGHLHRETAIARETVIDPAVTSSASTQKNKRSHSATPLTRGL